jgi:hypothetical protein
MALLKSGWARVRSRRPEDLASVQAPYERSPHSGAEQVRDRLWAELSPRQHEALTAAIQCKGTREAARTCGMAPRDFRRQLDAITRKARRHVHAGTLDAPLWDDA